MTKFLKQYKYIFFLSWMILYLIIPTWTLPISALARASVYFGLIGYFYGTAYLLHRWTNALAIDKPFFMPVRDWRKLVQDNIWLVIICLLAAIMHIKPLWLPILILGDETIHLQSGLWVYDYIDSNWQSFFQVAFWTVIGLLIIIKRFMWQSNRIISDNSARNAGVVLLFSFFLTYFFLFKDVEYYPTLIRYPPVSKLIYFLAYSAFGIHHIVPRTVQLIFYLLCSIYLYRTILLYDIKETALFGAAIYLFLPVPFAYAHLGELANGTIFFMVAISFYFLRFIKEGDSRDLLIASYLTGIGCLYKKIHFIMFIVCAAFLIAHTIRNRERPSIISLKIFSLSLVPIVPWMVVTKNFSWRNYTFQLSNLIPPEGKIVTYFPMIAVNISEVVSILAVLALFYIIFLKRNTLTIFWGWLFLAYFFFIVSDIGSLSPRFSMAFYPTIAVFISIFLSDIVQRVRWRHAWKLSFILLAGYLIIINAVPPFNERYLHIMDRKLLYFPSDASMKWVKENVKEGEKILTIRVMSYNFYKVKYSIDKSRIIGFWYDIKDINSPEKLRAFYKKNKVTYISFPYSPDYPYSRNTPMLDFLKENRGGEFINVAEFNIGDKFIYIYKVKDER